MTLFGQKKCRRSHGFSLLEMLIVLALIAITCHFVLGNYQSFNARNHRRTAEIVLLQTAAALEDYAADHVTYSGATLAKLQTHTHEIENYYLLEIKQIESDNFLLAAIPRGSQAVNDSCGVLLLDAAGRKSSSTHANDCW